MTIRNRNFDVNARAGTLLAASLTLLLSALPASAFSASLLTHKPRSRPDPISVVESALNARQLLLDNQHIAVDTELPSGLPLDAIHVSSAFGMRVHPINQLFSQHNGIDLSAPRGTPVLSTGDGVITKADASGTSSYGKYIVVQHHLGYSTLYAHLDEVNVSAGAHVQLRQVIGHSGNTGRSTGPHLHYEIRYQDEPIDPLRFLNRTRGNPQGISGTTKDLPWAGKSS